MDPLTLKLRPTSFLLLVILAGWGPREFWGFVRSATSRIWACQGVHECH